MVFFLAPPSFREREPEAPRYKGSTVPSRSFRFLQMMTQDDQQNDPTPVSGYTKPQQLLLNKYDEQNLLPNTNRLNEHPSRSFKYLQELTGEQKSTGKKKKKNFLNQLFILAFIERRMNTLSNQSNSTDIGTSDF